VLVIFSVMASSVKIKKCIFILCANIYVISCNIVVYDSNNDWEKVDCDNLKTGVINMDSGIVKSEINKFITELKPVVTNSDPFGHRRNLDILIERLNAHCDNMSAEIICYACIYTIPPQSEMLVTTD